MDFRKVVAEEDLDLARACLAFAEDEHPDLDAEACLGRLDAWAADVRARLARGDDARAALAHVLFDEAGFRGNAADYHDPDNSYLDRVIERRVGLPITLSVVYLEVARRAGVPVVGVGLPGHFLVKHVDDGVLVDPFRQGRAVTEDEARAIVHGLYQGRVEVTERELAAAPAQDILTRVLKNLKNAYVRRGDAARALRTTERLLELNPYAVEDVRDRGLLLHALGERDEAKTWLRRYLETMPRAPDRVAIEKVIEAP